MKLDMHTHLYRPEEDCMQVLNLRLRPEELKQMAGCSSTSEALECLHTDQGEAVPKEAPNLLLSAGIHPWDADCFPIPPDNLTKVLELVFSHPRIKYIGEIGLDKHSAADWQRQMEVFRLQLSLAKRLKKPVIIHCVKAMEQVLAAKTEFPGIPQWIIHGFRGNAVQARQWTDHGFWLSFGKNANMQALEACLGNACFETDDDLSK